MKTKNFSKKLLVTLSIVLIAVMALVIAGCTNNKTNEPTRTIGLHVSESNDKAKNLYKNVGFTLKEFEKDDDGSVSMAMTTTLEVWGQGIHKVLGI